jgi:thioesterase domain-containing protein
MGKVRAHAANLVRLGWPGRLAYARAEARWIATRLGRSVRRGLGLDGLPGAGRRVAAAHLSARRHYRPGPYPGRVVVFRTRHPLASRLPDPGFGWSGLAAGGLDVRIIESQYGSVAVPETLGQVAADIRALLAPHQAAVRGGACQAAPACRDSA